MNYIVIDLEWNQPRPEDELVKSPIVFDSDIIEIGAVKLDENFKITDEYCAFVKPAHYKFVNSKVAGLTKIKTKTLEDAKEFKEAFGDFLSWCGEDFAFMTWSTTDITVIIDNMIMYGVEADALPASYDIQRIFAHEISRDEKKWSLEEAVKMLRLPTERAHDALNDAKMTAAIAGCMELEEYLEEYVSIFFGALEDKIAAYSEKRVFDSLEAALNTEELLSFDCPYCGETLKCSDFADMGAGRKGSYAQCSEGDEFFVRFKPSRTPEGKCRVFRRIQLMNDDIWDTYQTALEQA